MPKAKIYTAFKGTQNEFTGTLMEISKHFNVKYENLTYRLRNNLTIDEAINYRKNIIYTAFKNTDKEFTGNLTEIGKHFGIKAKRISYRMHNLGMTIDKAIEFKDSRIKTVFAGTDKEFTGTLKEIAKHFNKSYYSLTDAISKSGKTLDEAIDFNYEIKNYTVFAGTDKEFTGNLIEICKHFGLKYSSILNKIRCYDFSVEEAISIPLRHFNNKNLSYKGIKGNLHEICKHFNKNYDDVYKNLLYNHTLEWAMEHARNDNNYENLH